MGTYAGTIDRVTDGNSVTAVDTQMVARARRRGCRERRDDASRKTAGRDAISAGTGYGTPSH